MDRIYRTTKYGFPCIFFTVKTCTGSGIVVVTIIPQYENEDILEMCSLAQEGEQAGARYTKMHTLIPKCARLFFMYDKLTYISKSQLNIPESQLCSLRSLTELLENVSIFKQWNPLWSPKFTVTDKSAVELGQLVKYSHQLFVYSVIFTEDKHGKDGFPKCTATGQK